MRYTITGGEDDGKVFDDITLSPCKDYSEFHAHYDAKQDEILQSHIAASQFFCPDAFDLSIYGQGTSPSSKIMSLEIGPCELDQDCKSTGTYFEGKQIAMLFNSKRVDVGGDEPKV